MRQKKEREKVRGSGGQRRIPQDWIVKKNPERKEGSFYVSGILYHLRNRDYLI